MYACTNFENKYIKIEITEKRSLYYLEDHGRKVKCILIPVKQFLENPADNQCTNDLGFRRDLNLTVTEVTPDEYDKIGQANQGLPIATLNESCKLILCIFYCIYLLILCIKWFRLTNPLIRICIPVIYD